MYTYLANFSMPKNWEDIDPSEFIGDVCTSLNQILRELEEDPDINVIRSCIQEQENGSLRMIIRQFLQANDLEQIRRALFELCLWADTVVDLTCKIKLCRITKNS